MSVGDGADCSEVYGNMDGGVHESRRYTLDGGGGTVAGEAIGLCVLAGLGVLPAHRLHL